MAKLAIKGHATRGKEVIEVLEMLGGKVTWIQNYCSVSHCYFINSAGEIDAFKIEDINYTERYKIFTLKEFLENYPYKVVDKVVINDHNEDIHTVVRMYWDNANETVEYSIKDSDGIVMHGWFASEFIPYKEDKTMNIKPNQTKDKCAFIDMSNAEYNDVEVFELLCMDKFEVEKEGDKLIITRKKPQYPKTYDDCVRVLQLTNFELPTASGYKAIEIEAFQQLIICRDAYWKIAGDWKPNWDDAEESKYAIWVDSNIFIMGTIETTNTILPFPTREMRDAFYENFKALIEECKELL